MKIEKLLKTTHKIPLRKRAILTMMVTSSAMERQVSEALKPYAISIQQFNVLRILRGQNGQALNLNEVHSRMVHKMSNTTRVIDKLVEKNLVDRVVCPENRRKVEISITAKGVDLLKTIDPVMQTTEKKALQALSPDEIKTLNTLLDKLNA